MDILNRKRTLIDRTEYYFQQQKQNNLLEQQQGQPESLQTEEQQTTLASLSSAMNLAEILCFKNDDCITTTYCCSTNSCVHPSKCLYGLKASEDICDYNFECESRCCHGSRCSPFLQCNQSCQSNTECHTAAVTAVEVGRFQGLKTTEQQPTDYIAPGADTDINNGCCSEGFCVHEVVCHGNKFNGDTCDHGRECLTGNCDNDENICTNGHTQLIEWSIVSVVAFVISLLIVFVIFFYCCKSCTRKTKSSYGVNNNSNSGQYRKQESLSKEQLQQEQYNKLLAKQLSKKPLDLQDPLLPKSPQNLKAAAESETDPNKQQLLLQQNQMRQQMLQTQLLAQVHKEEQLKKLSEWTSRRFLFSQTGTQPGRKSPKKRQIQTTTEPALLGDNDFLDADNDMQLYNQFSQRYQEMSANLRYAGMVSNPISEHITDEEPMQTSRQSNSFQMTSRRNSRKTPPAGSSQQICFNTSESAEQSSDDNNNSKTK